MLFNFFTAEVSRAPAMMSSQPLAVNGNRGGYSPGLIPTPVKAPLVLNIYMDYSKFNIHPYR